VADGSLNPRRRLSECVGVALDVADPWITGIAIDSRRVKRGDLFVAFRGERTDGHRFVRDAVAAGAAAVVVDSPIDAVDVPVVRVADAQREASIIASRFFDDPSRTLRCVGITGTNGKTSVSVHTAELLSKQGWRAAFGGTLGWGFAGRLCGSRLTTEDAVTLQRRLADLVRAGATAVAMEVSSHALAQHRADGVALEVGVFTNLTRDHLDYHGSMERYAEAKRRLFDFPSLAAAVINIDDPIGSRFARELRDRLRVVTYGATAARIFGGAISFSTWTGCAASSRHPGRTAPLRCRCTVSSRSRTSLPPSAPSGYSVRTSWPPSRPRASLHRRLGACSACARPESRSS
jgi:UDP-N-acetylmuramoyl-L-alanyl-D-glutamate--2,6-diaminopimelate ligase